MNKEYVDLVNKVKEKNKPFDDGLDDNARKIIDSILSANSEKNIEDYRKKILYRKEYLKENVTFGVVCVEKNILKPIDFNKEKVNIETYLKYDTCIITIDEYNNVIDNIMLKRFDNKEDALKYADQLSSLVEKNDFVNLIKIIDNSLEN